MFSLLSNQLKHQPLQRSDSAGVSPSSTSNGTEEEYTGVTIDDFVLSPALSTTPSYSPLDSRSPPSRIVPIVPIKRDDDNMSHMSKYSNRRALDGGPSSPNIFLNEVVKISSLIEDNREKINDMVSIIIILLSSSLLL